MNKFFGALMLLLGSTTVSAQITETGTRVGIDNANPLEKFQIGQLFTFHDGGTKVLGRNFFYANGHGNKMLSGEGISTLRFNKSGSLQLFTSPASADISTLSGYQGRVILTETGSFGIGTDVPAHKLHVHGSKMRKDGSTEVSTLLTNSSNGANDSDGLKTSLADKNATIVNQENGSFNLGTAGRTNQLSLAYNGRVGVATSNPTHKLHVAGNARITGLPLTSSAAVENVVMDANGILYRKAMGGTAWSTTANTIWTNKTVGIGTSADDYELYDERDYKLCVKGKIAANEIRVVDVASWPDYVFEDSYSLKSLEEVEVFIEENGHLPNVPAASEIDEKGFDMGEMNRVMMEKIEELTLYMIELKKSNDKAFEAIDALQEENALLRKVSAQ